MMIKVKVIGGLGNQLFQYATARAIAETRRENVVVDKSAFQSYETHPFCLDKFKCSAIFESGKKNIIDGFIYHHNIKKILLNLGFFKKHYFEKGLAFDETLLVRKNINSISGYFQSEKYFLNIRSILLDELTLIHKLNEKEERVSCKIKEAENSVSIHIRRGDYVSDENASKTHGVCDSAYFKKAIRYFFEKELIDKNTELFIFSDDIEWCRKNLSFEYTMNFVDGSSERPEVDMILMSQCSHQIISNSTFSWWGAWLNQNNEKVVVAPKIWFQSIELDSTDIIPENWIKV